MSWNSSTANAERPIGAASTLRSSIVWTAIAVEESASASPATSAATQPSPAAASPAASSAPHTASWIEPPPNTGRRISSEPSEIELEPDEEQHQHHAELGEVQDALDVAHQAESQRADRAAGDQVAEHRAEAEARGERHADHRGREIDHRVGDEGRAHRAASLAAPPGAAR